MNKAFQLRMIALGIGLAVIVASAGCAKAPPREEASEISHIEEDASDSSVEDSEYDDLFDEEFGQESEPNDPFERTNRALLSFNQGLTRVFFDPVLRGYRFVVPEPARKGIHRAFVNLNTPSTLVNDLLQLRFKDAATTLGRFILNTTIGYAGIFDVAIEAGWEHHESDFGQTLGRYGVGGGPYLVVPVFGPRTVRDGFGGIVDLFFQPLTYIIGPTPNIVIGASSGFSLLDAHFEALRALEESSIDYYAALRSAYLQSRAAHIRWPDE
jgi:phospholipid-binding lipoprotein MlaA